MLPWEEKAHKIIGELSHQAWDATNPKNRAGLRPRKSRPYHVPQTAQELVTCLGMHDRQAAEEQAKANFIKAFGEVFSRKVLIPG
jgi:hypothetical protein